MCKRAAIAQKRKSPASCLTILTPVLASTPHSIPTHPCSLHTSHPTPFSLAPQEEVRENIAYHMAYAHQCVTEASVRFLEAFRRYNYTTPKSYLELISLYKQLLASKRADLRAAKERLENGVDKIAQASAQVRVLGKGMSPLALS